MTTKVTGKKVVESIVMVVVKVTDQTKVMAKANVESIVIAKIKNVKKEKESIVIVVIVIEAAEVYEMLSETVI